MDLNVSEYNVGVFHNVNKITISSGWSKLSAHGVNELVRNSPIHIRVHNARRYSALWKVTERRVSMRFRAENG